MSNNRNKLVIIGGGPSGQAAAIYAARAQLNPVLYQGKPTVDMIPGGQLMTTTDVENYPGFKSVPGFELMERMADQATIYGTKIISETIVRADLSRRPFVLESSQGATILADALIISTGATARRLGVKGARLENGKWKIGVTACAVCDGPLSIFRNKPLAVIGGGDSAMEDAVFLTKYASKVYVIHRRDQLRASVYMQMKAKSNAKIEFVYSHVLKEIQGQDEVDAIVVESTQTGKQVRLEVRGVFYAIGHDPNTGFLKDQIELDTEGYVVTKPNSTETSVEGVFASGDVQDRKWKQAVTAAGTGCMAALEVEKYLERIGPANDTPKIE